MTGWTAIVPFKVAGERKTRLAERLSAEARGALSKRMFAHVVDVLKAHPAITAVVVLSDQRPERWSGGWVADGGRGLNTELEAARKGLAQTRLMVLHADLPLLKGVDVDALIARAEANGIAIAPDRHGSGTNGLALLPDSRIQFRFGPDSFRLHLEQAPESAVVRQQGFAIDLDTADDLVAAEEAGFRLETWLN